MAKKSPSSGRVRPRESVRRKLSKNEGVARRTRLLIGILALAGLGVFGVKKCASKPEPQTQAQTQAGTPENLLLPNLLPETNAEWLNQIHLPEMGPIVEGKIDLMDRLPKGVDRARLSHFDAETRRLFDEASKGLSGEKDMAVREKRIFEFLTRLFQGYKVAVGDNVPENFEMGSDRFYVQFQKINSVILPFGDFVIADYDLASKRLRIMSFHESSRSEIRVGDTKLPMINVGIAQALVTIPDGPTAYFNAELNPQSGIAVFDKKGAERQFEDTVANHRIRCERERFSPRAIDLKMGKLDAIALGVYHEAAHSFLSRKIHYDFRNSDSIKKRGDVPMGHYFLPYAMYAQSNNAQLHELFANGIGLMRSGASAVVTAHAIATIDSAENYRLASEVLWYELMNSPELHPSFRLRLAEEVGGTQRVSLDKIVVAIDLLSDESLHKIGERMAKLGLHLMEK
jgi:hypothetical protein